MFEDDSGVAPEWGWLNPADKGFVSLIESVSKVSDVGVGVESGDDSILGFIKFLAGRQGSPPFAVGRQGFVDKTKKEGE